MTLEIVKDLIRFLSIKIRQARSIRCPRFCFKGSVLIIAPHPDDEVLGCGGLIARLVKEGFPPHILIMSGGEHSHTSCCNTSSYEIIRARRELTLNAMIILGLPLNYLHFLNYPDGGISFENAETSRLVSLINDLKPNAIFVPHLGEGWSDHIETRDILKRLYKENKNVKLFEYCVWFWYYNVKHIKWKKARVFQMAKDLHDLKLKAIDAYVRPLAPCGKPWSGELPKVFIKANSSDKELYFEIDG